MAKRRNLKKEKELRNKAYARKYRKRNEKRRNFRFSRSFNRSGPGGDNQGAEMEETEGATDNV
ncbi:MAG TPA: hypothetical protein IGS52_15590 [Oscillatoriaceae cyanobacterium M33_DOE_052]|uniref:Uncharacterized protein n=1 Tax=Planktothricoides sp. SpSt-374 TaxID=2282167 RepID=A0A7C3ZUU1_9CYAN|nr:hypothetical protein [Oscillatoriaceae cyanobacterium M33_DOE_052]